MAWHLSRAFIHASENLRSSQAEEVASSVAAFSGGILSAQSKSTNMALRLSPRDKMMAAYRHSQFGMMYEPSMVFRGRDLLTSYREGFLARIFPSPELEMVSKACEAAFGERCGESLAKFDPSSSSWKTRQLSLLGGFEPFSETLPRWGIMRSGELWERKTPSGLKALRSSITKESEFGLLPTPTVHGNNNQHGITPKAGDGLATVVRKLDTPQLHGNHTRPAHRLATPLARDYRSGKAGSETLEKNSRPLSEQVGGSLNPTWIEWLQGWPLGWTELNCSAMAKFQRWLRSHGRS